MDDVILDILAQLREGEVLDAAALDRIVRAHSKRLHDGRRLIAKKRILPYYLDAKANNPALFSSWNVTENLDALFVRTLQMKPRRTASGVATITVITKPWKCSSNCIYCPCDIRMPKSYLHDEPACQRAERNFFDPFLQVQSRLKALEHMGHATDKIELIILGGSWTDYPRAYRLWFVSELFKALNSTLEERDATAQERRVFYEDAGISSDADELARQCSGIQSRIQDGEMSFNEAFDELYGKSEGWAEVARFQSSRLEELLCQQRANESADKRVVGLVVETRPDALDVKALEELRTLGCTKVQMGIQTLDDDILKRNGRVSSTDNVKTALGLCRLFGFKTHVHFMLNLLGSSPETDKAEYRELVTHPAYLPDEVKLYPCALVGGTALVEHYQKGIWRPYTEDELLDVLCDDMRVTPGYTRVSRMIRDISADDILVGNKKTNLRQLVEANLDEKAGAIEEIRFREIGTQAVDLETLSLKSISYETTISKELFLQWVTPDNGIVGFLRLSLPKPSALALYAGQLPIRPGEAMIREVHVYGFAAKISGSSASAQHHGLGKALIEKAAIIANEAGYHYLNVISAIGTREYYRRLGFEDNGLYQRRHLEG